MNNHRGFTLMELIVSVGLFAIVMTLATGGYLLMIAANRQAQGIVTGINDLSFALDSMTRTIRTGTLYGCPIEGNDCAGGGPTFIVTPVSGPPAITYTVLNGAITQNNVPLTNSSAVNILSLTFYVSGTKTERAGDSTHSQPHVTIVVSGTTLGKNSQTFTVETGATMRGSDL